MPLSTAALMAEECRAENCMATYFPFGPVACSSMSMTSPAFSLVAALLIAPAVLKTPLMTVEWTTALA